MTESTTYELGEQPLDPAALALELRAHDVGGVVTFLGIVRERTGGESQGVSAIEYEAYTAMAVPELRAIVDEAQRGTGARVVVRHRLGRVPAGEASVAVVAAAEHREAAFRAAQFAIDAVKKRVPIWKKEHFVDGTSRWVGGSVLDDLAPASPGGAHDAT